jgi:hypothetical protein
MLHKKKGKSLPGSGVTLAQLHALRAKRGFSMWVAATKSRTAVVVKSGVTDVCQSLPDLAACHFIAPKAADVTIGVDGE